MVLFDYFVMYQEFGGVDCGDEVQDVDDQCGFEKEYIVVVYVDQQEQQYVLDIYCVYCQYVVLCVWVVQYLLV